MDTCESCRFSKEKLPSLGLMDCRRFPPMPNPNFVAVGDYTLVKTDMWCGEYQAKGEGDA